MSVFTVLLLIIICRTAEFIVVSLQGKKQYSAEHIHPHTRILNLRTSCHSHTGWGFTGWRGRALCAIEGLEDSGYLEHDGAGLGVVHPLGAIQRILQHVFERCTQT